MDCLGRARICVDPGGGRPAVASREQVTGDTRPGLRSVLTGGEPLLGAATAISTGTRHRSAISWLAVVAATVLASSRIATSLQIGVGDDGFAVLQGMAGVREHLPYAATFAAGV